MSTLDERRKNFRWEQGVQYKLDLCASREEFKRDLEAMERDLRRSRPMGYLAARFKSVFRLDEEIARTRGVEYPTQIIRPYDSDRDEIIDT